jgi:hypothetical protein
MKLILNDLISFLITAILKDTILTNLIQQFAVGLSLIKLKIVQTLNFRVYIFPQSGRKQKELLRVCWDTSGSTLDFYHLGDIPIHM